MNRLTKGLRGLMCACLLGVMACEESPVDVLGEPGAETIVPTGRGKKGIGISTLVTPPVTEVSFSYDRIHVPGEAADFVSASAGGEARIVGTFDPAGSCPATATPGVWTEADGWAPIPAALDNTYYSLAGASDAGHIVGRRGTCDGVSVMWASLTEAETVLPGGGGPADVNSHGEAVGTVAERAVLWTPDGAGGMTIRDLHTELLAGLGFDRSYAVAINDRRQIAGHGKHNGGRGRAFLIDGDVVWFLDEADELGPDVGTSAGGINNADPVQISGVVRELDRSYVARWTVAADTVMTELLVPPAGFAGLTEDHINDRGEIFAWGAFTPAGSEDFESHLLVWTSVGAGQAVLDVAGGAYESEGQYHPLAIDNTAPEGTIRVLAENLLWVGSTLLQEAILFEIRID